MSLPYLDAAAVAKLGYPRAVDALEAALRGGLDPEADAPRTFVALDGGELIVMPSGAAGPAVVKLVTVGGEPRIQGVVVVFDPVTLAPAALVDGIALTNLRTAAVSALAVCHLARADARRLVIFGRGPQAHAHAEAIRAVRPIEEVELLGRHDPPDAVATADVVVCATTSRTPLFDGARVRDDATVVAIGSHEPDARETDDVLARRAAVVVESRTSALREAGDVIAAGLRAADLTTLADLVGGGAPAPGRPRLFKSTGMAWEDAVIAAAVVR